MHATVGAGLARAPQPSSTVLSRTPTGKGARNSAAARNSWTRGERVAREFDSMSNEVPETPGEFFESYIPRRFEEVKAALSGKTSIGSMVFRVVDAGEWSLRLENGELCIGSGMPE